MAKKLSLDPLSGRFIWTEGGGSGTGDFMADGSVPMTGDLDLNGNDLVSAGTPIVDVAPDGYVTLRAGTWDSGDGVHIDIGGAGGASEIYITNEATGDLWTVSIDDTIRDLQVVTPNGDRALRIQKDAPADSLRLDSDGVKVGQALTLDGIVSAALNADQDDWSPTGIENAAVLNLTPSGAYSITGFAGGADGRLLILRNLGGSTATLKHDDAGSIAANRMWLGFHDVVLAYRETVVLQYSASTSMWMLLAYSGRDLDGDVWGTIPNALTVIKAAKTFRLAGVVSPASIGANQNDYYPAGLDEAATLRLTSSGAYDITGINVSNWTGDADGRILVLHNIGSFAITLKDESGSSVAGYRFALEGDHVLLPDAAVVLQYDNTTTRWRIVGASRVPYGTSANTVAQGNDSRLADARTPTAHAASHQDGGGDELSVTGLSGVLADPQHPIIGSLGTEAVAGNDSRLTNARTPTAHATSHQPGGSDAMAVDAAAATGSLRTLGTGAAQAAAGNDSRLTNARTPTAHATTHQPGGTDAMAVDAAAATGSLRTLGTGAAQAAAGNDSRLSDARTPTAHATSHQPGGTDAMAVDAAAATGSLRTLGTGAAQAAAGNDSRFTDSRAPSGTASGDLGGTYPSPTVAQSSTAFALNGVISISISGGQNNWNPTGLATASVIRLTATGTPNITGLAGGASGRIIMLVNVAAGDFTILDESGSSTAANRFRLFDGSGPAPNPFHIRLKTGDALILQYDGTLQRWLILGNKPTSVSSSFALRGIQSAADITANQNDYNPDSDWTQTSVLRLNPTTSTRTITGLQGGQAGRIVVIHNVGAVNLVLSDESASSSAANRFALQASLELEPDACAFLQYDGTTSRWRSIASSNARCVVDVFTANGTWTKRAGAKWVEVIGFGGGGRGGGGSRQATGSNVGGGSGGGAGACVKKAFHPDALGATETVTIGAGGTTGGAGATVNGTGGTIGQAGGDSSFGSHLTAYGGGGGGPGAAAAGTAGGGGGGGSTSAGASNASAATSAIGGGPHLTGANSATRTQSSVTNYDGDSLEAGGDGGGGSTNGLSGGLGLRGGGGGGGSASGGNGPGGTGGGSLEGAGGGGAGGGRTTTGAGSAGSAGGAYGSYAAGGGAAGGAAGGATGAGGNAASAGTSRTGTGKGGDGGGGGGGSGNLLNTGGNGSAGGAPGGGGGGGGGGTAANGGAAGDGARGEVIVVTYF